MRELYIEELWPMRLERLVKGWVFLPLAADLEREDWHVVNRHIYVLLPSDAILRRMVLIEEF